MMAVFAGTFIIQMIYWWLVYARLIFHKSIPSRISRKPVSIVICAQNEEINLKSNMPLILEQDYPEYEVIVVDDASSDDTEDVLRDLGKIYPHLRSSRITENVHIRSGKKLALTVGLKAARYDWVLLTDADCQVDGRNWLATMQQNFRKDTGIVLGYGGYRREKGLLNLLIRYDTFFIALQYLGFALSGFPYMGVGRNLAYRKNIFFQNKGFASHYGLASGDDDLFINEVARKSGTRIEIGKGSHTTSDAKTSWREWYYQKRRHLTSGPRYNLLSKFILGVEILSRLAFYISFLFLMVFKIMPLLITGIFLLRLLSTIVIIKLAMNRLNEKYLLLISPLMDFALPWVHICMAFSNYVAFKRSRWK